MATGLLLGSILLGPLAAWATTWAVPALEGPAEGAEPPGEPAASEAEDANQGGQVLRVRLDAMIHSVSAEFIVDALEQADRSEAALVVIELSTPGGVDTSMREIFTKMLAVQTPVVVYVSPRGARAASAGFFLLMASDIAVMAPGTNTGAAAAVSIGGEDIPGTMGEKVQQDGAATIRSLASDHGRNVELAEKAVLEARSYTADEALEGGLIELVTPSFASLLQELEGREVTKHGEARILATADAPVTDLEMSIFQRALLVLATPDIAFLLLSLGGLGIYFELAHPGSIFPGVIGAIFLVLAFFGLSVLPVSYAGVALILLAVAFFLAEIKVPSFGLLTVAGVLCLVLGALMLFKTPEPALRVSLDVIIAMAVVAGLLVLFFAFVVARTYRHQVTTGAEGMVHKRGVARTAVDPRGKVFVFGEVWAARSEQPIVRGQEVEVVAVDGMELTVRPLEPVRMRTQPAAEEAPAGGAGG